MRTNCIYLDSETCGFHGLPVLIQYAYDGGPITLWEPWLNYPRNTLDLIEKILDKTLIGFNLCFDHFHLCKLYTTFRLLPLNELPVNLPVLQVAKAERDGRDGPCLKPRGALDLMLHSRKGEHQFLMSRNEVRIRKIPILISEVLREELEKRIIFDPILSAKWGIYDRQRKGIIDPEFKDIALRFHPDRGLKSLAKHCLGLDPEFHSFQEIYPEHDGKLFELGYIPFALGASDSEWRGYNRKGEFKGYAWPKHIHKDIEHWRSNNDARRYAEDDVKYTRLLDEYFGYPDPNDDDSILACMVAAVRWHGFKIDNEKINELLIGAEQLINSSPVNVNKPTEVRKYIKEVMDPSECLALDESTKKENLEKIRDKLVVTEEEVCITCMGTGCPRCAGKGNLSLGPMLASLRAAEILKIKSAVKEADMFKKLIKAGRFHASFKVIGTLSSRMAGGDGLNAQGIKKSKEVRESFPLAWDGMVLSGGDFESFEVTIADAVFKDNGIRRDLLNNISLHAVMATKLYSTTLEAIMASKGYADGGIIDMYTNGKKAIFGTIYGGDAGTIHRKLSIPMKVAEKAFDEFQQHYPGIKIARDKNAKAFSALIQKEGIGTRIEWNEPADYSETFLGFKRYFTLENQVIKELYVLAQTIPAYWNLKDENGEPIKLVRSNRDQTITGAVSSALYGAAFQLQSSNIRAANNHLIQSPGAQVTKAVQRAIWDIQPIRINEFIVAPMNVHDEVLSVTHPDYTEIVTEKVVETVESYRKYVPLIGMSWVTGLTSWGEKVSEDDIRVTKISHDRVKILSDMDDPDCDLMTFEMDIDEWENEEDEET